MPTQRYAGFSISDGAAVTIIETWSNMPINSLDGQQEPLRGLSAFSLGDGRRLNRDAEGFVDYDGRRYRIR